MTSHAKSSPLPLTANLQLLVFTTECQLAIAARRNDFACEAIQRRCEEQKVEALQARLYFKVGNCDQSSTAGTPSTTPYSIVEAYKVDVVHR